MFKLTKFKKGDRVQLIADLSQVHEVENVYFDKSHFRPREMVTLSNSTTYHQSELTFFSEPLLRLNKKHHDLLSKHAQTEKTITELQKSLKEFKEKVLGEPFNGYSFYASFMPRFLMGEPEVPKEKTLLDRIEALEKSAQPKGALVGGEEQKKVSSKKRA